MITFEHQRIFVLIGPRHKLGETLPRTKEVDAMVGVGTGLAYHPAPGGTVLAKKLPEAYMITEQKRHSSVTCSVFPADTPTAEACIVYLLEHMDGEVSPLALIDQFAQEQGRWYRFS